MTTQQANKPVLSIRDLCVSFELPEGSLEVLKNVSFDVPAGKTVALVGESGSGKSVLSQTILGILPQTLSATRTGQARFHDPKTNETTDLVEFDQDHPTMLNIRGGRISIIFQEPMTSLSPLHTIGNQIIEAITLHQNVDAQTARTICAGVLDAVGFPDPDRAVDMYPFELSGGLRQRAMIAMALSCQPAVLFADEPTTALDVTIQAQILQLVKKLQQKFGMAVVFITHDLGVVANIADYVVVLYKGEIMESGPCDKLFRNPGHPYLRALLGAVPKIGFREKRLTPVREVEIDKSALQKINNADRKVMNSGVLLACKGVEKTFAMRAGAFAFGAAQPKKQVLHMLDLEVHRGECLGLVGESGCGKTTISKILMGAIKADRGQVSYFGDGEPQDVQQMQGLQLQSFRQKVQFVFQDPFSSLNPRMRVRDILSEPMLVHNVGLPGERLERAKMLLKIVGLDETMINRYPHSFSGGERQRLSIARALMLMPELLICDEPVSALDVSVQAQILNMMRDLKRDLGLSMIFVSHNLAVVDYLVDRVAVMCCGRLVEIAPRDLLFSNALHPYTKRLLAAVPEPDLDRPLNYDMLHGTQTPDSWPDPFRDDDEMAMELVDMGGGHFVRMQSGNDGHLSSENLTALAMV